MKLKVPAPDTMDKLILVVAVIGIIIAFVTVKNIPTPEEQYARIHDSLQEVIDLMAESTKLVDDGNYWLACETQKQVTDIAVKNDVGSVGVDIENLIKIEAMICTYSQQESI